MEILVYVLSGILAISTSVNVVGDKIIKNKIESQVKSVDIVAVRIDNAPNHNALGGKVQRIRIATRDLAVSDAIAFKALELDIDGIDIKLKEWLNEDLVSDIDGVPCDWNHNIATTRSISLPKVYGRSISLPRVLIKVNNL